jgi:hypothetical protein
MMLKRPSNKSRTEVVRLAKQAVETNGGPNLARVWFKFDCFSCGSREIAPEPNVLPETATCAVCGAETKILGAGYALELRRSRFVDWNQPTNTIVIRKPYESDRGDA